MAAEVPQKGAGPEPDASNDAAEAAAADAAGAAGSKAPPRLPSAGGVGLRPQAPAPGGLNCEGGAGEAAGSAPSRPSLMEAAMRSAETLSTREPHCVTFEPECSGASSSSGETDSTRNDGEGRASAQGIAIAPERCVLQRATTKASTVSAQSVGTKWRKKLLTVMNDLDQVTGEPGDVQADPAWAYGEANLTFKDVEFSIRGKDGKDKVILAPTSGHFEAGSLVALMGPSGCGKTTLLDILAGKKTSPWSGTVHLNGRPRDKLFSRVTTYIPQDDIMPAHLTVGEVVTFYSGLKVEPPKGINKANWEFFIDERLRLLGLHEVKDTKIGNETVRGISGGQRRRVSLACGLSSMAQVFFADEPTSGLSGTDAEACIRYMRLLAKKMGLTLIVAIHQPRPEVACLFDHLLLLTANPGKVVYNGPMRDAQRVWEAVGYPVPEFANPTDHYLDLVTPGTRCGHPEVFVKYYEDNFRQGVDELVTAEIDKPLKTAMELLQGRRLLMEEFGELPPVRNTVYGVRFSEQLRRVFCKQLRLSVRDPLGIGMEMGVAIGQSIVIGFVYLNVGDKPAYTQMLFYFMLAMTVALVGMKVMPKLIDERLVVKKETSEALYSDWAYIISFSIINLISGVIGNTIFVVVVFWMSAAPWDIFPVVFCWTTLLYVVMDSVYTMVAAVAKDTTGAMTLALPFLTLFLLYNNFTVYRDILPVFMKWMISLSPVAYTIQEIAAAATELDPDGFSSIATQRDYRSQPGVALAVMATLWVVFRGLSVVCLKCLNNIRR